MYAETPGLRARQIAADLLAVAVVAGAVWLGMAAHDLLTLLVEPGVALEDAGNRLAGVAGGGAEGVGDLPLVGDALARPFEAVSGSGERIAGAGLRLQDTVLTVALATGVAVAALPALLVLLTYVPARLRWSAESQAARRMRAAGASPQWFALRALATRPLRVLGRVAPDPWAAYEAGEWQALAALELRRLGLRPAAGRSGGA